MIFVEEIRYTRNKRVLKSNDEDTHLLISVIALKKKRFFFLIINKFARRYIQIEFKNAFEISYKLAYALRYYLILEV